MFKADVLAPWHFRREDLHSMLCSVVRRLPREDETKNILGQLLSRNILDTT